MKNAHQVLVVGSFVQDLCWQCVAFPAPGQTMIGHFSTGPGGKGSNQAVAAARAGAATLFVGAVGGDFFAESARAFYADEGIESVLVGKQKAATGTAAILVDARAQNEIVVALGANALLRRKDVPAAAISQARVVVTQLESDLQTSAWVLQAARRAGSTTILNPAPMRPDFDLALLRHVDVLIPNETEFADLMMRLGKWTAATRLNVATLSAEVLHGLCRLLGPATVIVTLGAAGCLVSTPVGYARLEAYSGIDVLDTAGAGDAFVGGFAAGVVEFSGDVVRAARFANAVAALSVTKRGTAPAMPTRREIVAFIKKRGQ